MSNSKRFDGIFWLEGAPDCKGALNASNSGGSLRFHRGETFFLQVDDALAFIRKVVFVGARYQGAIAENPRCGIMAEKLGASADDWPEGTIVLGSHHGIRINNYFEVDHPRGFAFAIANLMQLPQRHAFQ